MNLLPKNDVKFAEKEYWDEFFKNRNNKEFEWYGEYPELCSLLHKYIKAQESILIVGCGNSSLSANLYDVGYLNIYNIDVSNVVIRQMKQLHRERTGMKYEVMDALNTTFDNESYSVVLDKGTLDALIPQDTDENLIRGRNLLLEAGRVLKFGGRYIVISLLQPHILRLILDVYVPMGWLIRICRCHEVEERTIEEVGQLRMPVFMIVCTKFKRIEGMPSGWPNATKRMALKKNINLSVMICKWLLRTILELNLGMNDEITRVKSPDEILTTVKEIQKCTAMCGAMQKQGLKSEMELEFRRDGDKTPRYNIIVVDAEGDNTKIRKYGAFIVPRGRETEWNFGSPEGRQLLRKTSGYDRLAVICLRRDHSYSSLDEIQKELSDSVVQLAPRGKRQQINFLTVGEGMGTREIIHTGFSEHSGEFVVEDVSVGDDKFRRLIFLRNQGIVQSEVKLKFVKRKKDKKGKWEIDSHHAACTHHRYMALAVAIHKSQPCSVLILGLGGGGLCIFLRSLFPSIVITAIDIDPLIINVAKEYFGVKPDEKLKIEAGCGLAFLMSCKEAEKLFDVIIMDLDSKAEGEAMSSPPESFIKPDILDTIASVVAPEGTLVVNMVCRLEEPKKRISNDLQKRFPLIAKYSLEEDVNELLFASKRSNIKQEIWKEEFKAAAWSINKNGKSNFSQKDTLLDLYHLFDNLVVTS